MSSPSDERSYVPRHSYPKIPNVDAKCALRHKHCIKREPTKGTKAPSAESWRGLFIFETRDHPMMNVARERRETLTLPRNRVGLVYMMPDNSVWRVEQWTGEEYVVRCEGGPPHCPFVDGDRQRLRVLPEERRLM